jgi:mycothiol synthase
VALENGRPVSCALAVSSGDTCGWWRIATHPAHRRQGLASVCVEAGERALRESGQQSLQTEAVVDSRWEAAGALFEALGYELEDPERRNITMVAEEWSPREVQLPDGYALDTLAEADLEEWTQVRNAVFGSEHGVEWFRGRFMEREEWDPSGWFVVRNQGRIVGIASGICVDQDWAGERMRGGQIEWVGVLEDHRGLHLGEELMVACLNHIAERQSLPALLITQPFRVPAVGLYEKLGFRTTAAWHRWVKGLG